MQSKRYMTRILKNRYKSLQHHNPNTSNQLVSYLVELFCTIMTDQQVQQIYDQPIPENQQGGKKLSKAEIDGQMSLDEVDY